MIDIAIIGVGKIARDQHVPSIANGQDFRLAATVTRREGIAGVANFPTIAAMAAALPSVKAIAVCTPPLERLAVVQEALAAGLDVLIEKPPAATLGEAQAIAAAAEASDRILYAAWHSREAAGVAPAAQWLADKQVRAIRIDWREDVRVWHPGQEWIWEPGIGVFDPGINALSILTRLRPGPILVDSARLRFPANRQAPIAADLVLNADGVPVQVGFDFDQRGPQSWDMRIETNAGTLDLKQGGTVPSVDSVALAVPDLPEYARVYQRFAECIATRTNDIDLTPLRLSVDAFFIGQREIVAPFDWAS